VMIVSLMLITAAGAIGLLCTLPPPVGRRLLLLLAVPAYPGAVALAASTSGSPGPLAAAVYLPTLLLACMAAGLVWRSRRRGQLPRTPESPADPAGTLP
jgi:peptidoglycan/LPS O-acetylase OafA/YrhL